MRKVLSSENFDGFGGTETYTLTVAQQLDALGHDVTIYSPNRGAIAEFASEEGVRVLGIDALPSVCGLVMFGWASLPHAYRNASQTDVAFMITVATPPW